MIAPPAARSSSSPAPRAATTALRSSPPAPRSAVEIARQLGPIFAKRASETTDEDKYVADNFALLKTSGLVEAGVPGLRFLLLAFDVRVREDGSEDLEGSMFRVPDEYVCAAARAFPGFLACASVHPYRADALERLERARGGSGRGQVAAERDGHRPGRAAAGGPPWR